MSKQLDRWTKLIGRHYKQACILICHNESHVILCNRSLNDAVICLNIRFKKYRHRGTEYYDDGLTLFSRFHPDGSGELFYPNGVLAIRVYRPENRKCNWVIYIMRFIQCRYSITTGVPVFTTIDSSTGLSIVYLVRRMEWVYYPVYYLDLICVLITY